MNVKKFASKHLFFLREPYHRFLVKKNMNYYKKHSDLTDWFENKYKKNFGRKPDFVSPSFFSEIVYCQMKDFNHPLGPTLVDKIEVKEYLRRIGFSKYLTKTIAVFDNADDVCFNDLPNEFVIKCNHDSGSTFLVDKSTNSIRDRDGRLYSFKKMKSNLKKMLKTSMFYQGFESQYKDVRPRILTEELIKTNEGFLKDFKIFCNYGVPKFIFIVLDRNDSGEKTVFVDVDFNILWASSSSITQKEVESIKPFCFQEMVSFASSISKDFKLARIDLYCVNNEIIRFGEIAFSHYGGTQTGSSYPDSEADLLMGRMLNE